MSIWLNLVAVSLSDFASVPIHASDCMFLHGNGGRELYCLKKKCNNGNTDLEKSLKKADPHLIAL